MNVKEHEPLWLHTTLRTGGPARFFIEATTAAELKEAVGFAHRQALPVFPLGGGSNVLAGDAGFNGVVVHIASAGIETNPAGADKFEVIAAAGESWDQLVAFAVGQGLCGLENLSLIPGTVGAAVAGNIGAYGAEVKDTLQWAEALDMRTGAVRLFTHTECQFGYRRSFFKSPAGRHLVVLRAAFALDKHGIPNTAYQDLKQYLSAGHAAAPTLPVVREAVIAIRQRKLPDPAQVATAGSFFKNPVIPRADYDALAARFPGLPAYETEPGLMKIALGWILDKVCGLKGARHGRVGTHSVQALVIVNEGGTAAEVETFANQIAQTVRQKTGLALEWEVEKLG